MASLLTFLPSSVLSTVNLKLITPNRSLLVYYSKSSLLNRIIQNLGFPEPPKRPANAYLRFQQEHLPELKQSAQSQKDLMVKSGAKWRELSAEQKEKYNKQFQAAMVEYKQMYKNYSEKLTPEQKRAIEEERIELKKNQALAIEKRDRKNELLDAGKPKNPQSAYLLFAVPKAKNLHVKVSDLKSEWDRLSEVQKLAYKQQAQHLRDDYELALKLWEDKMIAAGKPHLVRKLRFLTKSTVDKKPRKKSSEISHKQNKNINDENIIKSFKTLFKKE